MVSTEGFQRFSELDTKINQVEGVNDAKKKHETLAKKGNWILEGEQVSRNDFLFTPFLKSLYMERNAFGWDLDDSIYRIFQTEFLEYDVKNDCLTIPHACEANWIDSLENPLTRVRDADPLSRSVVELGELFADTFALCWTSSTFPRSDDWNAFSHGRAATRIEVKPRALLDQLMCLEDDGYMFRAWLGKVNYLPPKEIMSKQTAQHVYSLLESSGSEIALASMMVSDGYEDEEEVRLIFKYNPRSEWVCKNVELSERFIRIPFDWNGVILDRKEG